jgi:hypothetical protein
MISNKYNVGQLLPNGFDDENNIKQLQVIQGESKKSCDGCIFQDKISCKGHDERCGTNIIIDYKETL